MFINTISKSKYPELPENYYVTGNVSNFGHYAISDVYGINNLIYTINNKTVADVFNPTYQIGNNEVILKENCFAKNQDNQYTCDCFDSMKTGKKNFTVLDTTRIWIKKIIHTKTYSPTFGNYPDVYLVLNNFNIKSPTKKNYNASTDGDIVWDINDTLTICENYFNLSISTWDADQASKDDKLEEYFIRSTDVNNWETGTQNFYKNGGFTFEIVKLP